MKSNTYVAGRNKNGATRKFGGKSPHLTDVYKNYSEFCKKHDIELYVLDLQHIDKMINILPPLDRKTTLIEYARIRKSFQKEYIYDPSGNGRARREANLWLLNLAEKVAFEKLG